MVAARQVDYSIELAARRLVYNGAAELRLRQIIEILADQTPRLLDRAGFAGIHGGRCIPTAIVVRDVFRALGLPVELIPVQLVARNAAAAGQARVPQKPHVVDIGNPEDPPLWGGAWPRHLAVIVHGLLVDLTAGQASRPEKGIHMGAVCAPLLSPESVVYASGERITSLQHTDGARADWYAWPESTGYLRSPALKDARLQKIARKLLRKLPVTKG